MSRHRSESLQQPGCRASWRQRPKDAPSSLGHPKGPGHRNTVPRHSCPHRRCTLGSRSSSPMLLLDNDQLSLGWEETAVGGEGAGQQPAQQTRKVTRAAPPTHTHIPSLYTQPPLDPLTSQRGLARPGRGRWMSRPWGSQGLWPGAASTRVREGGQATGVALRATLRLRARMTEQADIPATGNKSPRQHSRLPVPCGWCPRAAAAWSEQ